MFVVDFLFHHIFADLAGSLISRLFAVVRKWMYNIKTMPQIYLDKIENVVKETHFLSHNTSEQNQ